MWRGCGISAALRLPLSDDLVNEAKRDPTHTVASARKRKKQKQEKAAGTVETRINFLVEWEINVFKHDLLVSEKNRVLGGRVFERCPTQSGDTA